MTPLTLPTHLRFMDPKGFIEAMILECTGKKTAIFLSESAANRLNFLPVIEKMSRRCALTWIKEIPSKPSSQDIVETLRSLKSSNYTLFIVIGGGSTLDLAKSCAALLFLNEDPIEDDLVIKSILSKSYLNQVKPLKLIGVPTTVGSGSELTQWATVWDFKNETILLIETPPFNEAFYIVEYTLSLPLRDSLSSGLIALTQATEAYWAKTTTPSLQILALQSIRRIVLNLPKVCADPLDTEARKAMMVGSLLGAMAFSNTKTSVCHSISTSLTLRFNLDYGCACAFVLGDLLRHNLSVLANPENVYEAFNINNPEQLSTWIEKLSDGIFSMRLSEYGVKEKDLNELVKASFEGSQMESNPVELSTDQLKMFLKRHL